MTTITITLDETIATQDVYSPDLAKFLHIDLLTQANIDAVLQIEQKKVADAQKVVDKLNALIQTKSAVIG